MRYIELFSGIGGMGYGLMQAGMECVGYCEIDKYAHKAFQLLHDPEERMWNAYDVRAVTDDDIRTLGRERGQIHLIAGGFPCQSFSMAGKRQGFADTTRGTLFFEIVRFASILRPQYLLLENVTGLLSHDEGRTFEAVIGTLDELGYVGEWCVLNSSAYVPQNRERVFIVATLGGQGRRKVFPLSTDGGQAAQLQGQQAITNCLKARYEATGDGSYVVEGQQHEERSGVISIDLKVQGSTTRRGVFKTERVGALDTQCAVAVTQGSRIRKLTPLECFRLQSFPDEWYHKIKESGISDAQLYKMAGNAVTSRVAYEIGVRLMRG